MIQNLILKQIKCEFLQIKKSHPKLTIYQKMTQTYFFKKINQLSCSLGRFFSEILDQLFHQLQLRHYVCTVLIGECIQKPLLQNLRTKTCFTIP